MNNRDHAFSNPSRFFDAMDPEVRDKVLEDFKKFAWSYATATAMGMEANGRRMPWKMTPEMQDSISAAALEVAMKSLKGEQS